MLSGVLLTSAAGLPALPAGIDPGQLPSLEKLRQLLADALTGGSSSVAAAADLWSGERASARETVLNNMLSETDQLPQSPAVSQLVSLLLPAGSDDKSNNVSPENDRFIDGQEILEAYLVSDRMTPSNQRLAFIRYCKRV